MANVEAMALIHVVQHQWSENRAFITDTNKSFSDTKNSRGLNMGLDQYIGLFVFCFPPIQYKKKPI